MKAYIFFYLLFTFIIVCNSCTEKTSQTSFIIHPNTCRMIIPVQLNDSITANMLFDTGAVDGIFRLDSSFVAKHPSLVPDVIPDTFRAGSSWIDYSVPILRYNDVSQKVKIDNTALMYDTLYICNMKYAWGTIGDGTEGIFNIPKNDTTHVWEWNFEYNYLKIHSADNFIMPKNCFLLPFERKGYYDNFVQLPLKIESSDGDTLSINQVFFIDTWRATKNNSSDR